MTVITQSKTVTPRSLFMPYQVERIEDPSPYMLDEKARRIGLTYAYGYRFTRKRAKKAGKTWYTANDTGTVLEFIDYCAYFARILNAAMEVVDEELKVADENDILTKVIRFKRGGRIIGLSSNPTALHGKGGDVIWDEFAYHKQAQTMWEAGQATAGWADELVMLSTHTSDDSVYNGHIKDAKRLYSVAADKAVVPGTEAFRKLALSIGVVPWSYRRTTIHDAVGQGLVEKINETKGCNKSREDFLLECRAKCRTDDQWKRQYLCEPSSDSSALLPYNLILPCVDDTVTKSIVSCENIYQGVDFARRRNLTAVANGEKKGGILYLRELKRLAQTKWRDQLEEISVALKLKQFRRGCYDQTGIGDMPVEELQRLFGIYAVTGVIFNNTIKANLALNLRHVFEDRLIRIPADQEFHASLNSVRKSTTATGKLMFDAEENENMSHADEFWATALMNEAANGETGPFAYESVQPPKGFRSRIPRQGFFV